MKKTNDIELDFSKVEKITVNNYPTSNQCIWNGFGYCLGVNLYLIIASLLIIIINYISGLLL